MRHLILCFFLMFGFNFGGCVSPYKLPDPMSDTESSVLTNFKGFNVISREGNSVYVGYNTYVLNCENYPGNLGSHLDHFLLTLSRSVENGLKCLNEQGDRGKKDAGRLLALFDERIKQRPIKIFCGTTGSSTGGNWLTREKVNADHAGMAFEPESEDFPGFHINLDKMDVSHSAERKRRLLFHEMLHWLGYRHTSDFDVPYIAGACCFSKKNEDACALLKEFPDHQSYEYLKRFAQVLDKSETSVLRAVDASIKAAVDKKNGNLLMATPEAFFGPDYERFLGQILARAAFWGSAGKQREKVEEVVTKTGLYPSDKSGHATFSDLLGQHLGKVIRGEQEGTHFIWSKIRESSETTCQQLSEDERYQLSLYIESATLAVLTADAIPWRDIKSWTNLCGINLFPSAYK